MSWLLSILLVIAILVLINGIIYFVLWLEYEFDFPIIGLLISICIIVIIVIIVHELLF